MHVFLSLQLSHSGVGPMNVNSMLMLKLRSYQRNLGGYACIYLSLYSTIDSVTLYYSYLAILHL